MLQYNPVRAMGIVYSVLLHEHPSNNGESSGKEHGYEMELAAIYELRHITSASIYHNRIKALASLHFLPEPERHRSSPLISPILVPYIIPYITPFKDLRLKLIILTPY